MFRQCEVVNRSFHCMLTAFGSAFYVAKKYDS